MTTTDSPLPAQIRVLPTSAMSAAHPYSDTALGQIFQAHVNVINAEVAAIWQRNTAMIVANSFMLSAVNHTPRIGAAGFVLCALLLLMTVRGWRHYLQLIVTARSFRWPHEPAELNPFCDPRIDAIVARPWRDWIFVAIIGVIVLFALTHFIIFAASFPCVRTLFGLLGPTIFVSDY